MILLPTDGSLLTPLPTLCQAAQMVPVHLDILLGSSVQEHSLKTILLDNWIEVSTSIQPDKHRAICDGVIQGRPLTCTCSAPAFQSLRQSLKRKNEGYFSAEQGKSICFTSLTTMWPVKLIQNYWSSEEQAPPQEKMRCVDKKRCIYGEVNPTEQRGRTKNTVQVIKGKGESLC